MKNRVYFALLIGLLTLSSGQAATRTWLSSDGGLWSNTLSWQDGILPGANDIADLSAATGTVDLAQDVVVGEILYNPLSITGTTNVLTILSDEAAPSSRTITLATSATNHLQVGEDAELRMEVDVLSNGNLLKDGYGTLVVRRRLYTTSVAEFYEYWIEQGRVINEGTISAPHFRLYLGTLEPETGAAPELVLREGSSYLSTSTDEHSDVRWGGNRLVGNGTGARAIVTHEGGILNLTTNLTQGAFINGYAVGGESTYNLSGGEVDLRNKVVYVGFNGTGTVNQSGGRFKANELNFSYTATGNGTYNLTGGELWLGGIAQPGKGKSAFNIGGACIYPLNTGFNIFVGTNPRFTGVGGLTRFCSEGSGFTNAISGFTGSGGFVKEGEDTLNISGWRHSFTGPIIVSNGTVNVSVAMTGGNAILVAGGEFNLNAGISAFFSSLMVTGGVFQVASNAVLVLKSADPWVQVQGTGTARLLDGSKLLRLDVSGTGMIDLSAGSTATVFRARINGIELTNGFYSAANCAAITGAGLLHVRFQNERRSIVDTFSRMDGPVAYDSLGETEEPGGTCWSEFLHYGGIGNVASVTNGELRLGVGNGEPGLTLTAAAWPNGMFSTRMRFNRIGPAGATVKNACGLILRRNSTVRTSWSGAVHILMTPAGGLFLREHYDSNKYTKNPFTGSTNYLAYGGPGSLPNSINGLPFDADGNGRLDDDEPFELRAILAGNRLQVLINEEPIMAYNGFTASSASEENCAGLWKNRLSRENDETHDSYHDDFSVTNLPYMIRHIGSFDPNIAAAAPRENWNFTGDTNQVPVGPVTEIIGGETVDAWRIDDTSTATLANYRTMLSAAEIADVNTNRWRLTMRLRVVNPNNAINGCVFGEVSTDDKRFMLDFGSDYSGDALVKLNGSSTYTVAGGSVYHTYVMEYDPVTASASLFCDDVLLVAGITGSGAGYNRVLWGANSSVNLGSAHYALVQFEILWPDPPPAPTPPLPPPPPGTLLILR